MIYPSQQFLVLLPDSFNLRAAHPLVVYHGGMGETMSAPNTALNTRTVIDALQAAGYIVAASNAHGDNWGNDNSLVDYSELYGFVAGLFRISRTVLLSASMGGCSEFLTAADRPFPIKGCAGIFPCCSLAAMYLVFPDSINAAYGISGDYETKTAGHDPLLRTASDYAGLRMRFYASPDDDVVVKVSNADALSAHVASVTLEEEVVVCSGEHGDASHFQSEDLISFLGRCV